MRAVIVIVLDATPFKVFNPVVGVRFVFMVDAWMMVRVRDECLGDKPMHPLWSAVSTPIGKAYCQIAVNIRALRQESTARVSLIVLACSCHPRHRIDIAEIVHYV
jgi:hypothetical protein